MRAPHRVAFLSVDVDADEPLRNILREAIAAKCRFYVIMAADAVRAEDDPRFGEEDRNTTLRVANLRRTAHSTGSSAGNLGDVQRFEHSPSVAVVTLCAYNASSSKLAQLSMSNKVRYCRIHSCTFVPFTERLDADRPIPWSKVLLVACQVLCVVFTMGWKWMHLRPSARVRDGTKFEVISRNSIYDPKFRVKES